MNKKKGVFKKLINHMHISDFNKSSYEYAVNFGLIGSLYLIVITSFSYTFLTLPIGFNLGLYILFIIILGIFLLLSFLIYQNDIKKNSKFAINFIALFPFLYIIFCVFSAYTYTLSTNQLILFVIAMLLLSGLEIYNYRKRILVFVFAYIVYIFGYFIHNGFDVEWSKHFGWITFSLLLSYVIATIHYKTYYKQREIINDLNMNKNETLKIINILEQKNKELKLSQKITATMLKLTQEVLKNDNIDDILRLVLDETMKLIPNAQAGSILILKENQKMEYVAARGYSLENLNKIDLYYKDLYQATLKDKFAPTVIQNVKVFDTIHVGKQKTEHLWSDVKDVAKACLTCSFRFEGKFYGSINIDNFDSIDAYNEYDKYLLKQLAQELEIIISIYSLYEKALRPTKFDELTQAYTRRHCIKLLGKTIDENIDESPISVCTLDIDKLKEINDEYGHDIGDKYLTFFSQSVKKSLNRENIFGRIGGDEFLLIFDGLNYDKSLDQINLIRKYFKKNKFIVDGCEREVLFSVGIAIYSTDDTDILKLIKISDNRMYDDKRTKHSKVNN